jgi:hypothetical protein
MTAPSHNAEWFKSSQSMQNGDCLEARHTPSGIDLRDSKNPTGPRLHLAAASWTAFITGIRTPQA